MRLSIKTIFLLTLAIAMNPVVASAAKDKHFRILSWNISADAFIAKQAEFQSLLRWADADVVLLDEVAPWAREEELAKALADLQPGDEGAWNINYGASGGRQRCVIASRAPQESLAEFSTVVPYPADGRQLVLALAPADKRARVEQSINDGIAVNGTVIKIGRKRLLTLITDLTCCGDGPESWQEVRRRVEATEIRRLLRQVLERTRVDGVIFAGDFNLVNSTFPMALLLGPYPRPHSGLVPAELYHPDGAATWTWDGRGMPFPSNVLDYQFYGPAGLELRSGFILDTEKLPAETLRRYGLDENSARRTGRHRPLVAEYGWR